MTGPDAGIWRRVNRALLAKAIGELAYEEAVAPVGEGDGRYRLPLASGVVYRFAGRRGVWDWIAVEPDSVRRVAGGVEAPADDAAQFFVDAQADVGMTAATLATYLREVANTLAADCRIAEANAGTTARDLADLHPDRLQCRLDGHPKAPANKGRLGWGPDDFAAYAPEHEPEFQPVWIAAGRDRCRLTLADGLSEDDLLAQSLDEGERKRLEDAARAAGVDGGRHRFLPVHPWQWDNKIRTAFAGDIAAGRIVPLGRFGDAYLPQQSLRTLSNAARPGRLDLKLPLTILNTSAYRGIPGRYMAVGPVLSRWLADTARRDPVLARARTIVLGEVAGAFYPHPIHEQIDGVPYQHREMLGAIWRESVHALTEPGERGIMMGALLQCAGDGRPLAGELIARSGLTAEDWLERLFGAVVVPLYHFLARYGVGFIAHGQNVTLVLRDHAPARVALKDLQGDCDLIDQDFPELDSLPAEVRAVLPRKPATHIVHNLQTAHFVTVLRFLSDLLHRHGFIDERDFYRALARTLRRYQAAHPDLARRFALFDLFRPAMPRVCINRVRFAIGYDDASQRPVPAVGSDLANPLHLAETA